MCVGWIALLFAFVAAVFSIFWSSATLQHVGSTQPGRSYRIQSGNVVEAHEAGHAALLQRVADELCHLCQRRFCGEGEKGCVCVWCSVCVVLCVGDNRRMFRLLRERRRN